MRASTQPTRFCASRTSHQSSSDWAGWTLSARRFFRLRTGRGSGRAGLLLRRGAFQHRNFRSRRKLVEMFGLASGRKMQVGLVAQDAGRLHGIAQVVLRELLQAIVGLLIHQIALLDPALEAARGAHAGEALFVLQHLHTFAVLHRADAVVDGGYLIAQRGLRR